MKKKILCIFGLILYLLVSCTILSHWIEDQMVTRVKISERNKRGSSFAFTQSVLFTDTEGEHLYEAVDGKGWSDGLRINELLPTSWYKDSFGSVNFAGTKQRYLFVISASRQPTQGEKVEVISDFSKSNDRYLYIYNADMPEDYTLPKKAELIGISENSLLISMEEAELPFLRQTAISQTEFTRTATHVFSLTEIEQFLNELPYITVLCVLLVAGVVFWGVTCFFGVCYTEKKLWTWVNIGLIFISLMSFVIILHFTKLPASMLPVKNIFDFQHYNDEIRLVYSTLRDLGRSDLLPPLDGVAQHCLIVFVTGILIVLLSALTEIVLFYRFLKQKAEDKHNLFANLNLTRS